MDTMRVLKELNEQTQMKCSFEYYIDEQRNTIEITVRWEDNYLIKRSISFLDMVKPKMTQEQFEDYLIKSFVEKRNADKCR